MEITWDPRAQTVDGTDTEEAGSEGAEGGSQVKSGLGEQGRAMMSEGL